MEDKILGLFTSQQNESIEIAKMMIQYNDFDVTKFFNCFAKKAYIEELSIKDFKITDKSISLEIDNTIQLDGFEIIYFFKAHVDIKKINHINTNLPIYPTLKGYSKSIFKVMFFNNGERDKNSGFETNISAIYDFIGTMGQNPIDTFQMIILPCFNKVRIKFNEYLSSEEFKYNFIKNIKGYLKK